MNTDAHANAIVVANAVANASANGMYTKSQVLHKKTCVI